MLTTNMVKPCDTCGDPGVIEAIITCCECKLAREHLYCMRVLKTQAPPFWRCEECDQNKLVSPKTTENKEQKTQKISSIMRKSTLVIEGPNKNLNASRLNFKEKRVDKGRTKYLSCEEAVNLSSGSKKLNHSPRKEFCSAYGMSKSMPPPSVGQRSTGLKEKATMSIKSPACERTPIKSPQEERKFGPHLQQPVFQQSFGPKEKMVLPLQKRGDATRSVKSPMSSRRVERTNPEREIKASKSEILPPRKEADINRHMEMPKSFKKLKKADTISGCKKNADVEAGSSDGGKSNLTSGWPVSEMHDPYIPSFNSYWKGSFYLPNGPQKLNDAFKAHPPSRIHCKVYETVKKMPENIYFELVPKHEIWMEVFQGYGPDRDDIGLYFFPMFKKRSENDISITDFLWRENLVMKSYVERVELLVFSSRVLPSLSQEFQGNYFLWGVFRRPKTVKKVADTRPLLEAKHEPCDDVPPGFKKIYKP